MVKGNGDSTSVGQGMLQEAVDAILAGMDRMQKEQRVERRKEIADANSSLKVYMDKRFDEINRKIEKNRKAIEGNGDRIEDLDSKIDINDRNVKAKISVARESSVSREEFEELREEVQRIKKTFAS